MTELVRETLPLNQKQFLVVRKILSHAIRHDGKLTLDAEDQMLFAVAGEGGVGKTRVIKAVELGLELLRRKDEVLLLAPTGLAAYNFCRDRNNGDEGRVCQSFKLSHGWFRRDRNNGDEDRVCSGRQSFKLAGLMKSDGNHGIWTLALFFERNCQWSLELTTVTCP